MAPNYNQQILALVAAASIDPIGFTPIAYGCSITRISSGLYKVILPTGLGVIDAQSFTHVTQKSGSGSLPVTITVSDESDTVKTILVGDNNGGGPADTGLEVSVQRAVASPF